MPDPTEDPLPEGAAPAVDPARFRQVLGHFPSGVTVMTTAHGDQLAGFAVGDFFSVSLEPPLVGFCADKRSSSWPVIREAGRFCVNILAEDQEALCRQFATKGVDRFAGTGWSPTAAGGPPRLADVLAWIDCSVEAVHDAGDHDICVGRVLEFGIEREGGPLVFYRGGYGRFES